MNYSHIDDGLLEEAKVSLQTMLKMDANNSFIELYVAYLMREKGDDVVAIAATLIELLRLAESPDSRRLASKILALYLSRNTKPVCKHEQISEPYSVMASYCGKCNALVEEV